MLLVRTESRSVESVKQVSSRRFHHKVRHPAHEARQGVVEVHAVAGSGKSVLRQPLVDMSHLGCYVDVENADCALKVSPGRKSIKVIAPDLHKQRVHDGEFRVHVRMGVQGHLCAWSVHEAGQGVCLRHQVSGHGEEVGCSGNKDFALTLTAGRI